MTAPAFRLFCSVSLALAAGAVCVVVPVLGFAADASPWDNGSHSQARLIAGTASHEGNVAVLRIDYAVCEKLCVPVDAKLELPLKSRSSAHESALSASEARVPKPVALGSAGPLSITAVRREAGPRHGRVLVDVVAPPGSRADLFAEGPDHDWALPLPQPVDGAAPGIQRFTLDLDGIPPGAQAQGAILRFTAVTDAAAIEVSARLD